MARLLYFRRYAAAPAQMAKKKAEYVELKNDREAYEAVKAKNLKRYHTGRQKLLKAARLEANERGTHMVCVLMEWKADIGKVA